MQYWTKIWAKEWSWANCQPDKAQAETLSGTCRAETPSDPTWTQAKRTPNNWKPKTSPSNSGPPISCSSYYHCSWLLRLLDCKCLTMCWMWRWGKSMSLRVQGTLWNGWINLCFSRDLWMHSLLKTVGQSSLTMTRPSTEPTNYSKILTTVFHHLTR